MARKNAVVSLSTTVSSAILIVGLLTLTLSMGLTSWVHSKEIKQESTRLIHALADVLAFNAVAPITFDQRKGLQRFLTTIKSIEDVETIHIYKRDEATNNLTYFTSFDREDSLPLPEQSERLNNLASPVFQNDYVEYAVPVIDNTSNEELGYVYLRLNLDKYQESINTQIKYTSAIAILVSVLAVLLAFALRGRILKPIDNFVDDIEKATKRKDFDYQLEPTEFREVQIVADAVNELLSKINRQIIRYSAAEAEIKEFNQNLEEKVILRTQALRDSNQELLDALEQVHQYQSQVIQSEKMASLGQMVAGVAHEVNTPIGLGVTASTMLSDKIDDIAHQLEKQTLTAPQLTKFLQESKENTQIIYRNLTRAADLISSFKQVAVDQTAGSVRKINIKEYIHEVITSMQPTLKKYRHQIEVECEDETYVTTKPGPINQIIINMIMNAIIHAFKSMEQGTITIKASVKNSTCYLQIKDNGCGIEEKVKQKVFDPFVTTNRGDGGSGLGLHLVYNLVTQALNGKISVHSEVGKGAQFNIEFPSNLEERL